MRKTLETEEMNTALVMLILLKCFRYSGAIMMHDYSDFPCGPTTRHVIFESKVLIILVWLCSVNSVVMELICSNRPMKIQHL